MAKGAWTELEEYRANDGSIHAARHAYADALAAVGGLLFVTNMGAVVFLPRVEAWVVLGGLGLGALLQMGIFARVGFVRLLGLGHVHWFAMVPWLLSRLDTIAEPAMYRWVVAVSVLCGLSLAIDTVDVLRYLRGERAPAVVFEG